MHRISRGGDEIEFLVESPRLFVFRVDGEGANAGNLRGLERALHGIFQEGLPDALTVPAAICGKKREQHDRDGVTRQPFGETYRRLFTGHLADLEPLQCLEGRRNHLPGGAEELSPVPPWLGAAAWSIGP